MDVEVAAALDHVFSPPDRGSHGIHESPSSDGCSVAENTLSCTRSSSWTTSRHLGYTARGQFRKMILVRQTREVQFWRSPRQPSARGVKLKSWRGQGSHARPFCGIDVVCGQLQDDRDVSL